MFKNILLTSKQVIEPDNPVLHRAIVLCQSQDVSLDIIIVMPDIHKAFDIANGQYPIEEIQQKIVQNTQDRMSEILTTVAPDLSVNVTIRFGKLYLATIRHVQQQHYDLVLKMAEPPGWLDHLFDSDDMHLMRKCPVPVWICDPRIPDNLHSVCVAVDFDQPTMEDGVSKINKTLIENAAFIALQDNAELNILHIYDAVMADFAAMWSDNPSEMEQDLLQDAQLSGKAAINSMLAWLKQRLGADLFTKLNITTHLETGKPEQQIPLVVERLEADLLVMSTVGRVGIKGLFIGNTAESVMLQLKSSIFAIKPEGFVSPVEG